MKFRSDRSCRLLWIIPIFLLVTATLFPQIESDINLGSLSNHRDTILSFGPRYENSAGADSMLEYLKFFAEQKDIPHQIYEIERSEQFHSYGRDIRYNIPGSQNSNLLLLIPYVANLNSTIDAGEQVTDNSAIISALLSILDQSPNRVPKSSVEIYFLGSTENEKSVREYLSRNSPIIPETVLYFTSTDLLSDKFTFLNGDAGIVSPLWLINYIESLLEAEDLSTGLANNRTQLYRIGMAKQGNIARLLQNEMNALEIRIEAENSADATQDSISSMRILDEILFETGEEVLASSADITGSWDQHYLNFRIGKRGTIFTEGRYVIGLLFILLIMLLWLILSRKRRIKYLKTLLRNFWNIPFFFAAMFGFIFIGSLIVGLIEVIRGIENLWRYIPVPLLILKILTASALFTVFFTLIRKLPVSRNGSFYSAAAIFMLSLDVIIFGIMNITFAYYFLWALFWAFIFSISRHRIVKFISAMLAPLLLIITLTNIILIQETLIIGELLSMSPGINLLATFILLPFLFMLIRLDLLFPHPSRGRAKKRGNFTLKYSALLMLVLLVVNLIITLAIHPFSEDNPSHITITSRLTREGNILGTIEADVAVEGSITAISQSNLENLNIDFQGETLLLERGEKVQNFPARQIPSRLESRGESVSFLGRTSYFIELASNGVSPTSIQLSLFTGTDTSIYDANLPYYSQTGRGLVRFFNGSNPPNPMILEFTLPSSVRPSLEIDATYILSTEDRKTERTYRQFTSIARETLLLRSNGVTEEK